MYKPVEIFAQVFFVFLTYDKVLLVAESYALEQSDYLLIKSLNFLHLERPQNWKWMLLLVLKRFTQFAPLMNRNKIVFL